MQHGNHRPLPQRMVILMGIPGAGATADVLAGCLASSQTVLEAASLQVGHQPSRSDSLGMLLQGNQLWQSSWRQWAGLGSIK